MGDATESMNQMLSGIRTVKAFQLEPQRQAEFEKSNANYLHRTKRMLQAKGLTAEPRSIREQAAKRGARSLRGKRVKSKDLLIFTRQLATMINAGLPLLQCLDILAEQPEEAAFADGLGLSLRRRRIGNHHETQSPRVGFHRLSPQGADRRHGP